jgi:hypothetical protein
MRQPLRRLQRKATLRECKLAHETLLQRIRFQQREAGAQRFRVVGADRTDEQLASIRDADHFVPGGKAIAGCHAGMLAWRR